MFSALSHLDSYEDDVWLWDLDWAVKKVKFNNKQVRLKCYLFWIQN